MEVVRVSVSVRNTMGCRHWLWVADAPYCLSAVTAEEIRGDLVFEKALRMPGPPALPAQG